MTKTKQFFMTQQVRKLQNIEKHLPTSKSEKSQEGNGHVLLKN